MADDVPHVTAPDGRRWRADSPGLGTALSRAAGQELSVRTEGDVPHHDDAPVHVITTAALTSLGARLGARPDPRRFRANLVVDLDRHDGTPGAWPEDDWLGRTLTVGGVVLRLTAPMQRCVMVNSAQPGLPADARVLRALADRSLHLGVMADVLVPGVVRAGDPVVVA